MAELCRRGEQAGGFVAILRAAAPADAEHREREHGLAIASIGGELVPFGSLLVVARYAQTVGVKLAEQRHGLRIALLLDLLCRPQERGEIEAALEGVEGHVGAGLRRLVRERRYRRRLRSRLRQHRLRPSAGGEQCAAEHGCDDAHCGGRRHPTGSGAFRRCAAAATAAAGPSAWSQMSSPTATKSAPALARRPTSSRLAAKPTQGL